MDKLAGEVIFADTPFVFLGDYVDGGHQTAEVVERLMDYQTRYPHWVFLQGNHEDMLLDALVYRSLTYGNPAMWWQQGGKETAASYGKRRTPPIEVRTFAASLNAIPQADLAWMNGLPRWHETDEYFFAHAGFDPDHDHPRDMDPSELIWIREPFIYGTRRWAKPVIFGHSVFREPYVQRHHPSGNIVKIGIDTCHHGHGRLTAAILDTEDPRRFQFVHSFESHRKD
jgi:serine/threonine protein phosphatase 1